MRNAIRSAQYSAQLSAGDLENEKLTEQATLATLYFQIRGQDTLQQLFNDTIVAFQKALAYNQVQYETGITDQISVVEAQNTLQNAEAPPLTSASLEPNSNMRSPYYSVESLPTFRFRLGLYIGLLPGFRSVSPPNYSSAGPISPRAERAMASANAQIGQAYAAYFPTFNLSSDAGIHQSAISVTCSILNNRTWSIGPSASETIFDAGLRTATVHQFIATYNADLAAYRQTVLTGFQQVEDGLARSPSLLQTIDRTTSSREVGRSSF